MGAHRKPPRIIEVYRDGRLLAEGTFEEVAQQMGVTEKAVAAYTTPYQMKQRAQRTRGNKRALVIVERQRKETEVAVYKGDTFLFIGEEQEAAEFLGVTLDTLRFYTTPSYKKRVSARKKVLKGAITVDIVEHDE